MREVRHMRCAHGCTHGREGAQRLSIAQAVCLVQSIAEQFLWRQYDAAPVTKNPLLLQRPGSEENSNREGGLTLHAPLKDVDREFVPSEMTPRITSPKAEKLSRDLWAESKLTLTQADKVNILKRFFASAPKLRIPEGPAKGYETIGPLSRFQDFFSLALIEKSGDDFLNYPLDYSREKLATHPRVLGTPSVQFEGVERNVYGDTVMSSSERWNAAPIELTDDELYWLGQYRATVANERKYGARDKKAAHSTAQATQTNTAQALAALKAIDQSVLDLHKNEEEDL